MPSNFWEVSDTADLKSKIQEIYSLEQLSGGDSAVHRLHPGAKLLVTLVYIVTVVSFDRYTFGRLIPYVFYPFIIMALSETPWRMVSKRVLLALPFVVLAGVSNIIFDTDPAIIIGSVAISRGVLSCAAIVFRTFLCVTAVMILVAVTPFAHLSSQLRRIHVPEIFILLFEMTYRYIGSLLEETSSMYMAYQLRHTHHKGLEMKHMGPFVGQLLLRSFDRAERIYAAMKCRGYGSFGAEHAIRPWKAADYAFSAVVCIPCILLRVFDATAILNQLIGRWIA